MLEMLLILDQFSGLTHVKFEENVAYEYISEL
jgi:hypothetical protein